MKNILIAGLGVAVLIGLLAVTQGTGQVRGVSTSEPITIGAVMILSGEGASWGEASRNGMELAIEDINSQGGVLGRSVRGIYEDDGSDPKQTIAAFTKLTSLDSVQFIIGPNWSKLGTAVKDLAAEKKVIMISPSLGVKEFNESNDYLFNTWQHDYFIAENLADYVYKTGHRHVALFGAQDEWVKDQTTHFKARFESLGGTVDMVYEPTTDTTDVRAEVAKVRANKKIDGVVLTTDGYSLTVVVAKQLREAGATLPLFNITTDAKIVADCAQACEGMIFPTSLTPTASFAEKYKAKYGRDVEIGADSAYDAVMMLAEAMEATNSTDPEKVKVFLAGIKNYEGVSGHLTSDGKRAFTKEYLLKVVHNGVAVDLAN